jgi:hypothetical protein
MEGLRSLKRPDAADRRLKGADVAEPVKTEPAQPA